MLSAVVVTALGADTEPVTLTFEKTRAADAELAVPASAATTNARRSVVFFILLSFLC
jgi:hypothetical protein